MKSFDEWTPVCAENSEDTIKIGVWNRDIVFERSVLPTSVKIGGEEILCSPITLTAEFSGERGEWEKQYCFLTEQTEERVSYAVSQTARNLIVNANLTIEFDGLIKIDLRIIPFWCYSKENEPKITKLYIDIPVKRKYSKYFHFWPNCESGVSLSKEILNSYEINKERECLPFKPYIWTGWEYGGIGLCCESDEGFELDNAEECITVTADEEYTNIHIALLDHMPADWQGRREDWGNNLNPICYTLGIQATPVKPMRKNYLSEHKIAYCHFAGDDSVYKRVEGRGDTFIEKMHKKGVKYIFLHENWSLIQNYGFPKDEERLKQFVDDCHSLGMKVVPYFGYEMSSLYPDFSAKRNEYLVKNTKGNFVGGWQRPPMQRDFIACYHGGYGEIMTERVINAMDKYGMDGIYTDGTYVPWECANEEHGCGYRDRYGRLHEIYPIFAAREHVKRLYKAVHERGGIIDTHQSSCCLMATLAFADSYIDGENIQGMLQESIENMRLDSFRAEYMGLNMGLPAAFISYTNAETGIEKIAGVGLLHNIYPRASINDLDYMSEVWRVLDGFAADSAEWLPYWENRLLTAKNKKTYISCYKKEDELLAVIVCYDKEHTEITLDTDTKYTLAYDELNGGEPLKINNGILTVPIKYAELCLVRITAR